jgi:hypothetical protein
MGRATSGYPIPEGDKAWIKSRFTRLGERISEVKRLAQDASRVGRGLHTALDPLDRLGKYGDQVTDWNNVKETGFYWSSSAANAPVSGVLYLGVVLYHDGNDRVVQKLHRADTTTTSVEWTRYWTGSAWTAWRRSDNLLIPGTVFGGTAAAQVDRTSLFDKHTGRYNAPSGDKYVAFDDVFTAEFRAYEILFQWYAGASNGGGVRFRKDGAEIAPAAGYLYQLMYISGSATPAGLQGATNQGSFPPHAGEGFNGEIWVGEPMYTAGGNNQKRMRGRWAGFNPASTVIAESSLTGYDTQAIDGFSIYLSDQGLAGFTSGAHSWVSVRGLA